MKAAHWIGCVALAASVCVPVARADAVIDWNEKACAIVGKVGPGAPGHRMMAIVQVSVYDAVANITGSGKPYLTKIDAAPGASVDAAIAAANRTALLDLVPAEKEAIEGAYQAALAKIPDGAAKSDGIAVGEKAAAAVVARGAADGAGAPDMYQPHTTPGVYVPTMIPVSASWAKRKPWVMDRPDQFRPGPPPGLDSATWKRDYQEVMMIGGKNSMQRTKEQTDMARFWEETRPLVYHPLLRAVANMPGRNVAQNARLYAVATAGVDDAMIAIFDAKYTYNFWRPVTAIRNGGGNKSLAAEAGWTPFVPTPMHPEYPCAHCVVSGALGAVLDAELAGATAPMLSSSSPSAGDATREWKSIAAFMEEVRMARIYDGVHYRNSTEVGNDIGQKVGALAVAKFGR